MAKWEQLFLLLAVLVWERSTLSSSLFLDLRQTFRVCQTLDLPDQGRRLVLSGSLWWKAQRALEPFPINKCQRMSKDAAFIRFKEIRIASVLITLPLSRAWRGDGRREYKS